MKIRFFNKKAVRKARRSENRRRRDQEHKERIAKWHPKFVIWPRQLHTPDDDAQYKTVAFFETIWQKGRIVNNVGPTHYDQTIWTRHTEKDYFIKKLEGTLEPEETFRHDGTDMNMGAMASSPQSFSSSK